MIYTILEKYKKNYLMQYVLSRNTNIKSLGVIRVYSAHLSYEEIKEFATSQGMAGSEEIIARASEHIGYCQDCLDKVNKMREQIAAMGNISKDRSANLRKIEENEIANSKEEKAQIVQEIGNIELEIDSLMKRVAELKTRLNDDRQGPGQLE